ncbi:MAG: TetR/AcrR family transcriptional regulator [Glaciihabitans sp.]|jgi:AcrR family transcriptional regulator|nr:TetR/AcrR family transcriptional regulator [Glaciihabitans sp.]MDQ1571002.1 hypothetical protein [Actinomycetota bacterium]
MSVDERRASIIDAVIPMLVEHGRAVTTRQIADAAGIAEGTIFRAFGDKESLFAAAVDKFFDPEPLRNSLRSIDPSLSLEQKLSDILFHLRSRFVGIFGIMNALGMSERPPARSERQEYVEIIATVLAPNIDELNLPPERIAHFIRMVAFSTAIPRMNEGSEFSTAELASLIRLGVAGLPAERTGTHAS